MFSDEQKDILIGSMLGDGHLQLNANNRSVNARLGRKFSITDLGKTVFRRSSL